MTFGFNSWAFHFHEKYITKRKLSYLLYRAYTILFSKSQYLEPEILHKQSKNKILRQEEEEDTKMRSKWPWIEISGVESIRSNKIICPLSPIIFRGKKELFQNISYHKNPNNLDDRPLYQLSKLNAYNLWIMYCCSFLHLNHNCIIYTNAICLCVCKCGVDFPCEVMVIESYVSWHQLSLPRIELPQTKTLIINQIAKFCEAYGLSWEF